MSERATMNISLPESMKAWVEERVEAEGYGTASEYFRNLVRLEQKRQAREEVERKLQEAIDSGPATEMTREGWDAIRREVHRRLAGQRRKKAG